MYCYYDRVLVPGSWHMADSTARSEGRNRTQGHAKVAGNTTEGRTVTVRTRRRVVVRSPVGVESSRIRVVRKMGPNVGYKAT